MDQILNSIIELNALNCLSIKVASFVSASLLLILLLCKALALGNAQIGISAIRIIIRNVRIGGEARVNLLVGRDAAEGDRSFLLVTAGGDWR